MWRISDDFWDDWKLLRQQFDYTRDWAQFVGKNDTWPDADMLPLGKLRVTSNEGGGAPSKFTLDEQQTVMTLWSIFRSPLIFGGDLPSNDAATTALITNEEVLEVNQHSTAAIRRWTEAICACGSPMAHGRARNTSRCLTWAQRRETFLLGWTEVGISSQQMDARDLWTTKPLGRSVASR